MRIGGGTFLYLGGLESAREVRAIFKNKYIIIHKTTNASELLGLRVIREKRKNYTPRKFAALRYSFKFRGCALIRIERLRMRISVKWTRRPRQRGNEVKVSIDENLYSRLPIANIEQLTGGEKAYFKGTWE